jgi:hypothetical protein
LAWFWHWFSSSPSLRQFMPLMIVPLDLALWDDAAMPFSSLALRALRPLALALLTTMPLMGCTDRPVAVSTVLRPQPVLQSAGQWQAVARDVAAAISAHLEFQTGKKAPVQIYMMRHDDTIFADAFLSAIATYLVQKGHLVAVDGRPDIIAVGIDVMAVKSNPQRRAASIAPGPLSLIGAGVAVAAALTGDIFPWGITAAVAGGEAAITKPRETNVELILTVSIAREGFYAFRTTAVYYVNEDDLLSYIQRERGGRGRTMNLNAVPVGSIAYDLAGNPFIPQ